MILVQRNPFRNRSEAVEEVADVVAVPIAEPAARPCRSDTHNAIGIATVRSIIKIPVRLLLPRCITGILIPHRTDGCEARGVTSHRLITPGLLLDGIHSFCAK